MPTKLLTALMDVSSLFGITCEMVREKNTGCAET
jgi:hypothetical protein